MGLPASEYSDRIVFSRKSGDRGPCLHPLGGLQGGYTLGQAQALIGGMKEAKPECQAIIFFFFFLRQYCLGDQDRGGGTSTPQGALGQVQIVRSSYGTLPLQSLTD